VRGAQQSLQCNLLGGGGNFCEYFIPYNSHPIKAERRAEEPLWRQRHSFAYLYMVSKIHEWIYMVYI